MNEEPNQATNPTTNEESTDQLDNQAPETEESTDQSTLENQDDAGDDAGDDDTAGAGAPSNQASVSTQAPSSAADDDDDDYGKQILPDDQELPVFDPSKLPVGDDGLIDVNVIGAQLNEIMQKRDEALMTRIQRQQRSVDTERAGWDDVFDKHEDVKTDGELRDDIQAYRMGRYQMTGKLMSPQKAADRYFKRFGAAKEQGIEQARKNTQVQNSAYNDAGSRRVNTEEQRTAKLNEQMRSSDPEVREKASHEMLKNALFPKN